MPEAGREGEAGSELLSVLLVSSEGAGARGRGLGAARGRHRPNPCPCPQGSMYDGLADNYNNYGSSSRSSFYSKFQAGNGSWGYPVRSRFLGACGHGPRFEQEKAYWLLRRGLGAAGSPRGSPHL